jgi:hypothetical protein
MKKVVSIFLAVIMILSFCICVKVAAGQSREAEDINLDNIVQYDNKENQYCQYISRKAALAIKENYEFTSTKIDVTQEAVDVHISGEAAETAEAEIKSYVSKCFDVPLEYVNLYFD